MFYLPLFLQGQRAYGGGSPNWLRQRITKAGIFPCLIRSPKPKHYRAATMATKCWFVLAQTHYPPPTLPQTGFGKVRGAGPVCLGHLIPDLRHLDNVINRQGPLDIPPDMPIYPTKAWDITRDVKESSDIGVSGKVGVPIATTAGITTSVDASITFKRTTKNYWEFASLETFIFQPTSEYIEDSVDDDEVVAYHRKRAAFSTSSLFMITGIIVARGAKKVSLAFRKRDVHGSPSL